MYDSGQIYSIFSFLLYTPEYQNIRNYKCTCCFVWVFRYEVLDRIFKRKTE